MSEDMFKIDIENINIEDIMTQIRKKIKDSGVVDEEIKFDKNSSEEEMLQEYLRIVNNTCSVISDRNITSHRRGIGKAIVLLKRMVRKTIHWYTQPIVEQQNEFNAYATRTLNSMTARLEKIDGGINEQIKKIDYEINEKLKVIDELNTRIIVLEDDLNKRKEKLHFDYFKFEEKYRGSQEEIKDRLKIYLEYFREANNILDIGCGRGEFLELLKENNIDALGIDIEDDMVLQCKDKGLSVINIDALKYLSNLEDNSLGGIIMTQVIEHMEPNYLIDIIELAYKKLKPGAYFIAETINPQSLIVFTEAYFMDLSHVRMIHPYTIKFLVEAKGFSDVTINHLSKVGDDLRLPEVNEFPAEFNNAIHKLNDVVYGYREYAVIGRK